MRLLLAALVLAPIILAICTPSSSEPIFILNCRLINRGDQIFRQHCKAQDRQDRVCRERDCFARQKQKANTDRSTVPAAQTIIDSSLLEPASPASTTATAESNVENSTAERPVSSLDAPPAAESVTGTSSDATTNDDSINPQGTGSAASGTNVQSGGTDAADSQADNSAGETESSGGDPSGSLSGSGSDSVSDVENSTSGTM
jgi:hypothetical protein